MESIRRAVNPLPSEEYEEWNRLRSESIKAFRAFQTYRDLAFDRTLKKTAEVLKKSTGHGSIGLVGRWAVEYSWKSRARSWDVYQDRIAQRETIKERVKARKSALETANRMAELALDGLKNLNSQSVTDPSDLVRLADTAWKIQQSVLGKVEEEKATTVHLHFRNIAEKPKVFEPKTIEGEES